MLDHFKNDGVEVLNNKNVLIDEKINYSDEYIEKNWKNMILNLKRGEID